MPSAEPRPGAGPMRIFLAGATGVLGIRILRLLLAEGHTVAAMTRSPGKAGHLRELGASPVICDVFDAAALAAAVTGFKPDAVMHQLTDLPDQAGDLTAFAARNDRIRTEGTRNLVAAATAARTRYFLAQSIAWRLSGRGAVIDEHESRVLAVGGVVVRYGQLYGPGTFYEDHVPEPPRIHVDTAARATPPLIQAPSGVVLLTEETEALGTQ
ncbi:MAG TPA: NAD(P)H-binding protein [Streptosporangiaceae bacterium]